MQEEEEEVKGGGGVTHTLKPSSKKEEIAIPFLVLFFSFPIPLLEVWKAH